MNVTISIHGWDWVWLVAGVALGSFCWGFFEGVGREFAELYRAIRMSNARRRARR